MFVYVLLAGCPLRNIFIFTTSSDYCLDELVNHLVGKKKVDFSSSESEVSRQCLVLSSRQSKNPKICIVTQRKTANIHN